MTDDEPREEDPQKKKQTVTFTNLMRAIHNLKLYKKLSPREFTFFIGLLCKANEIFPRFPKEFSLTNDQAVELGAESVSTLKRVRKSLADKRVQGKWLLKYEKGDRWTEKYGKYRINYAFLLSCISSNNNASHDLEAKNGLKMKNHETSKAANNNASHDLEAKNGLKMKNLEAKNGPSFKELEFKEEISLSPDPISGFYTGIGQRKISRGKRERAERDIEELQKDKFTLDEIQFTVDWTLKNAKDKPYDFSIIKHTIGQAIAHKEKLDAEKTRRSQEEWAVAEERAKWEKENEEKARMENYKKSLSPEERAKLRERALAEIRKSDGIKKPFINEPLIETKENELIRSQPDWRSTIT